MIDRTVGLAAKQDLRSALTDREHSDQHESARLAEIMSLGVLDGKLTFDLDLIVQMAAALFTVPIAFVSIIDAHRQIYKAAFGLALRESPRELSICECTIKTPNRVLVVSDASTDERFANHPLVTGEPRIRFYAGSPLVSSNGFVLGTLCVIDRQPRTFSDEQSRGLRALAAFVMRLLEQGKSARETVPVAATPGRPQSPAVAVFRWDRLARIVGWNSVAQTMLGWSAAEVLGQCPPFLCDADRASFIRDCDSVLTASRDIARRCTIETKGGCLLQVAIGMARDNAADGPALGVSTIEVIGERLEAERRLAMLESVVVNSTDTVIVTVGTPADGIRNRIVYVNEAFTRMTGYRAEEAIGKTPDMLQGPATDQNEIRRISKALARREAVSAELVNYRKDGSQYSAECSISPVIDADGWCIHFIAIERDTTSRKAREKYEQERSLVLEMAVRNEPLDTQLARIVMLLKSVIPGSIGTVVLLRENRFWLAAADPQLSPQYLATIEGLEIGPRVGSCGTALYHREAVICGDISTDPRWEGYRDIAHAAGLYACWSVPFFAADGHPVGAFALYADRPQLPTARQLQLFEETARFAALVVDRHRDRQRLERLALYDGLTDLPNRKYVEEALAAAMTSAAAANDSVAIGVLDIDRFKAINDAFGHHVGDRLLRCIADRLTGALREGDIVGRMAGDEFIIVFTRLSGGGEGVAAATHLLDQFNAAFNVEGYEIVVRPSLGLAFFPVTSTEMAGLLQAADKAMYGAKLRGGGLAIATIPAGESTLNQLDLEKDLRYALDREQFELYYQTMYDLRDGRPVGAEALVRWNHPHRGLVGPIDFVPLAEANGTIVPIGTWVIGEAARVARGWQDAGHDAFITVNVSALQFDSAGLVATVVAALERWALEPHRLHLELTESLVMRNPSVCAATLLQLKALGVRIVIDDFGTGYSSLAYLQRFCFDALKIDRAFVRGIGDQTIGARSEHIITAVVQLAAALGVETIAEGVENATQCAFVQNCGCTVVQGFFCARPVPATRLSWKRLNALLPEHTRRHQVPPSPPRP